MIGMYFIKTAGLALSLTVTSTTAQQLLSNRYGLAGVNATYDYVIVGGGTAGLAVAYRLAEDGSKTVAVIEAGGFTEVEGGNTSVVPAYCYQYGAVDPQSANTFPLTDWGFLTTPQQGLNNRTLHYGRGKMLGGSSSQNAMIYNRGTIGSYQAWASAVNDSSWSFEELLPYFAGGCNYTTVDPNNTYRSANSSFIPVLANPDASNVTGGPLHLSFPNFALGISSWMQLSLRALGFPDQQDFLSGYLLGAQYAPVTVDPEGQVRSSSKESYLTAAFISQRQNLKVYTHALAKQITFDHNKKATGVRVRSERGQPYLISATREVVLSAGAFHSPQLLMVSGIGPKDELAKFNIPVLVDHPGIGQNMWDHLDFGPSYRIDVEGLTAQYSDFNARAAQEYIANRTGILTSPQVEFIGWEKLPAANRVNFTAGAEADLAQFSSDWPEVEYEITEAPLGVSPIPAAYGTAIAVLVAPLSRGTVTLASNDTADLPIISPNWLTHPTDQQVAVQALKRARQMFETEVIQPLLIGDEVAPGKNVTSDADLLNWIRNNAYQNWHASCTCKMGIPSDPMAVVNSKAQVFGVSGLRVVDASSFALLPPGHPQSTVYVMAEKIAADILRDASMEHSEK